MNTSGLARRIRAAAEGKPRALIAVVGAPGAGKSTLSEALHETLGEGSAVVPMDGFHLDDGLLEARGHRARKGAPHTFDVAGFAVLLERLRAVEPETLIPVFDRRLEISRAAARAITPEDRILLVEGNYLLLDEPRWRDLARYWDLSIYLDIPEAELTRRLMDRWHTHGKTEDEARAWIEGNDLPNIRTVLTRSRPADITVTPD